MKKITIKQLQCKKCGHAWIPRHPKPPKVCPNCKRANWRTGKGACTLAAQGKGK